MPYARFYNMVRNARAVCPVSSIGAYCTESFGCSRQVVLGGNLMFNKFYQS